MNSKGRWHTVQICSRTFLILVINQLLHKPHSSHSVPAQHLYNAQRRHIHYVPISSRCSPYAVNAIRATASRIAERGDVVYYLCRGQFNVVRWRLGCNSLILAFQNHKICPSSPKEDQGGGIPIEWDRAWSYWILAFSNTRKALRYQVTATDS